VFGVKMWTMDEERPTNDDKNQTRDGKMPTKIGRVTTTVEKILFALLVFMTLLCMVCLWIAGTQATYWTGYCGEIIDSYKENNPQCFTEAIPNDFIIGNLSDYSWPGKENS
jgi:hypothetical protein